MQAAAERAPSVAPFAASVGQVAARSILAGIGPEGNCEEGSEWRGGPVLEQKTRGWNERLR